MQKDERALGAFFLILTAIIIAQGVWSQKEETRSMSIVHTGILECVTFQPMITTTNSNFTQKGITTIKFKDGYVLQGPITLKNRAWEVGAEYDLFSSRWSYELRPHERGR